MNWTRGSLIVVLALVGSASVGCRNDHEYRSAPVQAGGISIRTQSIEATSVRMQVRAFITNNGGVPITIDPSAVTFTTPSGQTVSGVGPHLSNRSTVIMPQSQGRVGIDFRSEGFNFVRERGGQINWTGGITVNGQPVAVPPSVVGY
jgi:hypothetical protein